VDPPAESFQVLLAQPVAVANAAGVAVPGAVGLDGEDHLRRVVGVGGGEVDPVAADAVLRHERDAKRRQPGRHVRLEGRLGGGSRAGSRHRHPGGEGGVGGWGE
jgi:hypothetical protein